MAKVGRKEKYTTHVQPRLDSILAWRRKGLSEAQIAENLGVSVSQFNVYKQQFSELTDALRTGLDDAVSHVENALFKRCMGYEWDDVETGTRNKGQDEYTKTTHKVIPPDTEAIKFYLKNRDSKEWKDKTEVDMGLTGLSDDELADRIVKLAGLTDTPQGDSERA